ncbi:LuxR family transcriptional regulator [Loktanella sp. DSM 29012]|uniref:autoinducer binding domain-containing protein n=1 Tax=Loktanella sp. DSM 29012 TaxID=1881056 RepID=UPI0008CBFF47|nr:autoinducer binding domain-containing protein [Loktanella sp. DSM 29012]SEQ36887.1 LuxR family transcriptional regulator [Loktanella sp. DSM 29012]
MTVQSEIERHTRELVKMAPSGLFYALHFRFALPLMHYHSYPRDWTDRYTERAYALRDPVILWGFGNSGTARWSDIQLPDPENIIGQAREFGMNYGFVVATGSIKSRTIASAARADREFTQSEITQFAKTIETMHRLVEPPGSLSAAQIEALALIAGGDRHAAAAAKLGISESALKARLAAARTNLKARTTVEAIQRARNYKLL